MELRQFGDMDAETILIQPVSGRELEEIEVELDHLGRLTGGRGVLLYAVVVEDWNRDLSPWAAPAVFGREDFGGGAAATLDWMRSELPSVLPEGRQVILGGYSLAGLFALWAAGRWERFDGVAAASASVWFPGFVDAVREQPPRTGRVYLSLGDREARTRNPVLSTVADRMREVHDTLAGLGIDCALEWNPGNHVKDAPLRMAKGFAWLMNGTT